MNENGPATSTLQNQELPKAADMLERVRTEAAELRGFTITFLSLLLYVAIIISSTTHEQILRIDPVKLPLLDVEIPIVGFYWFMPGFLFFLHLYILVQHYLFSQLAFRFRSALERESDEETKTHLRRSLGNLPFLHWLAGQHGGFMNFLMTAFTVVSLIIWPVWTFWWLQAAFLPYHDNTIVWTQRTFMLLDAALLAYLWAKILDDEDDAGRWWKPSLAPFLFIVARPVKAALAWLCRQTRLFEALHWPRLRQLIERLSAYPGPGINAATPSRRVALKTVLERWLLFVFLVGALFFSFIVSTIPDSPEEYFWTEHLPEFLIDSSHENATMSDENRRRTLTLTNLLHEQRNVFLRDNERNDYEPERLRECGDEKVPELQSQTDTPKPNNAIVNADKKEQLKCYFIDGPFPRNLIMNERILIANRDLPPELLSQLDAKNDKTAPDALAKAQGLDLRGRHLEYADFRRSSLAHADMRRARLRSANFSWAKLEEARLQFAEMPGAYLTEAQLPGADLRLAQLPGASLTWAKLPGADLGGAKLIGASLYEAQLPGADLRGAELVGADLRRAKLPAANLRGFDTDDDGDGAILLYSTDLTGADLLSAELTGADLSGAELAVTDLDRAKLPGALLLYINSPLSQEQAKEAADRLYYALQDLAKFQGKTGQTELQQRVDDFRQKLAKPADFSQLRSNHGCLAGASTLKNLKFCKDIDDPEAKRSVYEIWRDLACRDETERHRVAQRMIERAEQADFGDFASLLAAKLQKSDNCPGLKNLDDKWKKRLLEAAKRQSTAK